MMGQSWRRNFEAAKKFTLDVKLVNENAFVAKPVSGHKCDIHVKNLRVCSKDKKHGD
jgi:hypothetical protein